MKKEAKSPIMLNGADEGDGGRWEERVVRERGEVGKKRGLKGLNIHGTPALDHVKCSLTPSRKSSINTYKVSVVNESIVNESIVNG